VSEGLNVHNPQCNWGSIKPSEYQPIGLNKTGFIALQTFPPPIWRKIMSCAQNSRSFQLLMEHSALAEHLQMETK
jgi:hypothetical protein